MTQTGWYNRNKLGYSVKHEAHRHSLAARGIKTAMPKGVKNVSFALSPTPNFDMVKKGFDMRQYVYKMQWLSSPKEAFKLMNLLGVRGFDEIILRDRDLNIIDSYSGYTMYDSERAILETKKYIRASMKKNPTITQIEFLRR